MVPYTFFEMTTLSTVEAFKFSLFSVFFFQYLLQHLFNFIQKTFFFHDFLFFFFTLLTCGLEIPPAVSLASAKVTVSVKVVFCLEHTTSLMSGPHMPLTNASVLILPINGWFSPGYVGCTNLSTTIAKA